MTTHTWTLSPVDTWFFRESRPHGTVGGSELVSLFPPPARTVAGALRTTIGELAGIRWADFALGQAVSPRFADLDLAQEIGGPASLGRLELRGPWLMLGDERLYPAPAFLLEGEATLGRLRPGDQPSKTDLGRCYLPEVGEAGRKVRSVEGAWLTGSQLQRVLQGELPSPTDLVRTLWQEEPRLGIGRNNARRTVETSLLYQTRHIRLYPEVKLAVEVSGVDPRLHPPQALVRFGGEGRLAAVTTTPTAPASRPTAQAPPGSRGVVLVLLTAGRFEGGWLPHGFKPATDEQGAHVWQGEIGGVAVTLVSAVLGRAQREGGWDLALEKPRPVESLVPAGSCWFARVEGGLEEAVARLDGLHIGLETELGRGELAAGYWT